MAVWARRRWRWHVALLLLLAFLVILPVILLGGFSSFGTQYEIGSSVISAISIHSPIGDPPALFTMAGVDGNATGSVLTVDGNHYDYTSLAGGLELSWDLGSVHNFCWQSNIIGPGMQFVLEHSNASLTSSMGLTETTNLQYGCGIVQVGNDNGAIFRIKADYQKLVSVDFVVSGNGSITPTGFGYYPAVIPLKIHASPGPGSIFAGWNSSSPGIVVQNPLAADTEVTLNSPGTITASFVESSGAGGGGFLYDLFVYSALIPLYNFSNQLPPAAALSFAVVLTFVLVQLPSLLQTWRQGRRSSWEMWVLPVLAVFFFAFMGGVSAATIYLIDWAFNSGILTIFILFPILIALPLILVYFFLRTFWLDLAGLLVGYSLTHALVFSNPPLPHGLELLALVRTSWFLPLLVPGLLLLFLALAAMFLREGGMGSHTQLFSFVVIGLILELVALPIYIATLLLYVPIALVLWIAAIR
jgi:hypothetical protein